MEMTSLEKAQYIVKTGGCVGLSCDRGGGAGNECPSYEVCHTTTGNAGKLDMGAIQVARDYIAKETKVETIAPGTRVWVSDVSAELALENRESRLYVCLSPDGKGHYCIESSEEYEQVFRRGGGTVIIVPWGYVVPVPEEPAKEMTIEDIQNELGYKVKIVEAP